MNSNKKLARTAGLWYLLMAITGPIGLLIVPAKILVEGDATATVQNLMNSEFLFRIGIAANYVTQIAFVFLVLALYRLFKDVDRGYAWLMVSFVLVSVPIAFLNLLNPLAALFLVGGSSFLTAFEPQQLNALVMFFINLEQFGVNIVQVFWGLWLLPFGILVYKSGFIPKFLGVLLVLACIGYVVQSFTYVLFPSASELVASIATVPESVGELSMVLWLLIVGAREPKLAFAKAL